MVEEDRLIFNSYDPFETTVSATAILVHPNEPISIGVPLPNYMCCLLDMKQQDNQLRVIQANYVLAVHELP